MTNGIILFEQSEYEDWHTWYYKYYTKSEHWKSLNEQAMSFYINCALCSNKGQVIHHSNYDHLGVELIGRDITLLCNRCHGIFHLKIKNADLPGGDKLIIPATAGIINRELVTKALFKKRKFVSRFVQP